jgi:hypothetical protein
LRLNPVSFNRSIEFLSLTCISVIKWYGSTIRQSVDFSICQFHDVQQRLVESSRAFVQRPARHGAIIDVGRCNGFGNVAVDVVPGKTMALEPAFNALFKRCFCAVVVVKSSCFGKNNLLPDFSLLPVTFNAISFSV